MKKRKDELVQRELHNKLGDLWQRAFLGVEAVKTGLYDKEGRPLMRLEASWDESLYAELQAACEANGIDLEQAVASELKRLVRFHQEQLEAKRPA